MANWQGTVRTNYVKVKDKEALAAFFKDVEVEIFYHPTQPDMAALFPKTDDGDFSHIYSDEADDYIEIDWLKDIVPLLEDGQVLVVMGAGAEKQRYVTGYAVAYTAGHPPVVLNLSSIYQKAADTFKIPLDQITPAEY